MGFVYICTGRMRFGLQGLGMTDTKTEGGWVGKPVYHYKDSFS